MQCKVCGKPMEEKLTKTLSDKTVYQCECGQKKEQVNNPKLSLDTKED